LALSAFSAYFAVKYHEGATFDADTGVSHEVTEVKNEQGRGTEVDLWTGCYTPRELRLLMEKVGMAVDHIYSVEPGRYVADPPSVETPEFLLIASATPFRR
ncbi:MAG: class I SAM-dependent methyltransferase, partial [Actinobacteria bacterium]|nr:class I SAM-dependent methyltransferase [Actinomycetota bacterium]